MFIRGVNIFRSGGVFQINRELTLMETFQDNGYETYAVGKWHNDFTSFQKSFSNDAKLFFRGMSDHYEVPYHDYQEDGKYQEKDLKISHQHSTELFTDTAIKFLESYDQEHPFFLYVAYTTPHDPRTAPREYHELYNTDEIELPPNFMKEHPFDNGDLNVRDEHLAKLPRDEHEIKQHIADYCA